MNIIKYYEHQFQIDLTFLLNSTETKQDRLSIVSLIDTMSASGFYGDVQNAFKALDDKPSFLICYFYTVLIDQAIHSYSKVLHHDFEKIAGYPKFVGILSSYWHNFEPSLLLLIAIKYIKEEENFNNKFEIFTRYILNDYIVFFKDIFPKYTLLLSNKSKIDSALNSIFYDITISLRKENIPTSIWNNSFKKDEIKFYYNLIDILQEELKVINKRQTNG
jgi:hypothetical protein